MAKLMRMKGPNGLRPCRTCKILGISGENNTHYVPCFRHDGESYDPLDLPLRTHDEFIDDAVSVEKATTNAEAERRAKDTGINGLPVLATLSSLEFPASTCSHSGATYKKLDVGTGDYILQPKVVEDIGRDCVAAGDTTPTAFGARVPNIATQLHYFTAESYTLWTTLLAPVVLRGRFPHKRYYDHFLGLVDIFNDCLSMSLSREYVDNDLRARIGKWVTDYERYYYQYDESRLSACPLTIHALLHIPDDILNGGPMWTYWNYITESFSRRLREIAQNTAIKVKYQLYTELDLSPWHEEELSGHVVAGYNGIRVLRPRATGPLSNRLTTAVSEHIQNRYRVSPAVALQSLPDDFTHWGRISFLASGGDKMRGADLVHHSEGYMTRDASFVKASHFLYWTLGLIPFSTRTMLIQMLIIRAKHELMSDRWPMDNSSAFSNSPSLFHLSVTRPPVRSFSPPFAQ
ncbi:hypothetical protein MIND_01284300 [Mycena indigotica]|uniref:DUF4218 domain-containing protein n=1 Tax=Mycena indigotica TaxID=2126181 RepID=A0A8H6S2S9_9AGAR|nr:uncharacterized protein MIND_01284300 [Mycena indigotica]KAF7291397.1 hypothetical protein MIND_01284300 [Mycena indigotica]